MGLKIGRFLQKQVKSVVKRLPAIVGGVTTMGPIGAALALVQKPAAASFQPTGGSGGFPTISLDPFMARQFNHEATLPTPAPAAGALPAIIAGMNRITAMAIARLAAALGVTFTLQSLPRVGMRLWATMMAFARRHPGVSIIGLLTALGLAADEAAHFLSWGATRKKKRRGRGISARDIRTCRRTMRRMAHFQRDMFRAAPRRRGGRGGAPSTLIAQN